MATNIKYEPGWSLNLTCTKPDKPNSGDPRSHRQPDRDCSPRTKTLPGRRWSTPAPSSRNSPSKTTAAQVSMSGIRSGITMTRTRRSTTSRPRDTTTASALEAVTAGGDRDDPGLSWLCPGRRGRHRRGAVGATRLASSAVTTDKILNANVTVPKLSATANSRPIIVPLGTVSETTSQVAFVAPTAGSLNAAKIVTKTPVVANGTKYWTFTLTDLGDDGTGTDKIVEMTTGGDRACGIHLRSASARSTRSTRCSRRATSCSSRRPRPSPQPLSPRRR